MLWRPAVTALSSTSGRASETHAGGHDPYVAGVNQKWSGSTHHHRKPNPSQLRLQWLLEQQQGRHLSWQSPSKGATLMTQVYGSLELLWIKCSPMAPAHATAVSQCW
jgi:hypothetical protein